MLFVDVVVLLGVYAGCRVYELVRSRGKNDESTDDGTLSGSDSQPVETTDSRALARTLHSQGVGAGVAAMGLSTLGVVGVAVPYATVSSLIFTIYGTVPMLRRAEQSLTEKSLDNHVLSSIISLATLAIGEVFAAGLQAAAYHLALLVTDFARETTERAIIESVDEPTTVWRRAGKAEVATVIADLKLGDIVVVRAGETIAVDGTICAGYATIDERALRGEPLPIEKQMGDRVFASTVVISGSIDIKLHESGADTMAARIENLLHEATGFKSQIQLAGEHWSDRAALPVLLLSACSYPFVGLSPAIGMLFAAPTNAIRGAGSLMTASYLTNASRRGILVADGRGLEALADVDTVLFDKTGTLTENALYLEEIHSLGNLHEQMLLTVAAALDNRVEHPVARAIVAEAKQRQIRLPAVDEPAVVLGGGVSGTVQGRHVKVGSLAWMRREGVEIRSWSAEGGRIATHVFVAIDGVTEGVLTLRPRIRAEAAAVVIALRKLGVRHIAVVSGDAPGPTQEVARILGLDAWHAQVLPGDKAEIVVAHQRQGRRVCFVGDGINDALAMGRADVSITLAGGAYLTMQTAQLLLRSGNLRELPGLFTTSRQLSRDLKLTLGIWAGYSVIAIGGAGLLGSGVMTTAWIYSGTIAISGLFAVKPLLLRPERLTVGFSPA